MTDYSHLGIAELAALIAGHLEQNGIEVVLVGGLAVEIYSENLYLTHDIDMVNTNYRTAALPEAMAELGFHKQGRVYVHSSTPITVEFPTAPLWVGDEQVQKTTVAELPAGRIPILGVEDIVKDRIAAFVHWRDTQSLVQAVAILLKHALAPESFQAYFEREGTREQYSLLLQLHERGLAVTDITMAKLEGELAELLLQAI